MNCIDCIPVENTFGRLPCLTWSRGKAEKHWRERKLIPASSLVLFGARFNGSKIDH